MKAIATTTYTQLTGMKPPTALPILELGKRLPSLVDVDGLLTYVANGGSVPPEVIGKAKEGTQVELVGPLLDNNIVVEEIRLTMKSVEALLAIIDNVAALMPGSGIEASPLPTAR